MKGRCALKRQSGENVQGLMMEVAARNPIRPVQYGGSSSSWEVRPEPSRRREAEEQLGGDVVRARLQNLQGVVRTAEEARPQPPEELEAAVDSICKHVKEPGCTWQNRMSGDFLARAFGEVGERIQRAPRCGCGPAVWMGFGFGGWSTGVLEDVTCRASRIGDRITAAESKPWIKDEREARLQGTKHLNFCCAVYRWQTERGVHFLHEHPWGASSWDLDCLKAVRELPGAVVVRCDQRLYGLVERWPLKEGGWGNVHRRSGLVG